MKFNKDLDNYIAKRKTVLSGERREGFDLKIKLGKKQREERVPDLAPRKVHILYKKPGFFERMFPKKDPFRDMPEVDEEFDAVTGMKKKIDVTNKEIKNLRKEEDVLEKKREGLLSRLFRSLRKREEIEEDTVPIQTEPELDEETVETIRLMGKWLTKLDTEIKKEFRDSGDYAKYKAFIDKYGLGKKKQ
ncbi:MAG: hypothetical protein V1866_03380 [archaeon]